MHKIFKVSTKAAIFNANKDKVIAIYINGRDAYGLPGGHIEDDETPDQAMARELLEECGNVSDDLRHADFFIHSEGKLVLAYIGSSSVVEFKSQQNELEGKPMWLSQKEFAATNIDKGYKDFVLNNWPKVNL